MAPWDLSHHPLSYLEIVVIIQPERRNAYLSVDSHDVVEV
jgi:hypothetical protein